MFCNFRHRCIQPEFKSVTWNYIVNYSSQQKNSVVHVIIFYGDGVRKMHFITSETILDTMRSAKWSSIERNVRDIYETWGFSPRGNYDSKQDMALGFGVI